MSIPAPFRAELTRRSDNPPIVTNGVTPAGECLWLYPFEDWCEYEQRISSLSPDNLDAQAFARFMISGATECPIDNQGRSLLPPFLREHAQLEREVMIAGVGPRIEIWNKTKFDDDQSNTQAHFQRISSVVAQLGDS